MKNIFGLSFITALFLWTGCSNETKKFEYGSNDGSHVNISNSKIYYEEYGQGMPILLLSGGGLNRSIKDFEKCIPELSKNYRVIGPDTPGQGRSEQADSLSYDVITEFMSQFIDSLKIDSLYVIGWSDGGIVGLLLAEKRPDKVKKVISVGLNNGLRGAVPPNIPLDSVKPLSLHEWEKNNKESIDKYVNTLPRDWKKQVNDLNKMWYQEEYFSKSIYGRIKVPIMIVYGDQEDIMTEHGLEIHRLIRESQFCVLPNTSHEVFSERPDLINKIAIDFFSK